jgi:hypothetical protein
MHSDHLQNLVLPQLEHAWNVPRLQLYECVCVLLWKVYPVNLSNKKGNWTYLGIPWRDFEELSRWCLPVPLIKKAKHNLFPSLLLAYIRRFSQVRFQWGETIHLRFQWTWIQRVRFARARGQSFYDLGSKFTTGANLAWLLKAAPWVSGNVPYEYRHLVYIKHDPCSSKWTHEMPFWWTRGHLIFLYLGSFVRRLVQLYSLLFGYPTERGWFIAGSWMDRLLLREGLFRRMLHFDWDIEDYGYQ